MFQIKKDKSFPNVATLAGQFYPESVLLIFGYLLLSFSDFMLARLVLTTLR